MKKILLSCLITVSTFLCAYATHQRAGEITYRHLSGLKYEATIVTYSYSPSAADRNELVLRWGDGDSSVLQRNNGPSGFSPSGLYCEHLGEMVGIDIKKNIYTGIHTYPTSSSYYLSLEDPNRNSGIINIPNSVEVPLYIETQLIINPFLGSDNSPELLMPPVDNGCVGVPYMHNPGAFDSDGDSLSYQLVSCRGAMGQVIPGYTLPQASHAFSINPVTGDIYWDSPEEIGEYNIAFLIEEWRNGQRIGYVTRDMQINIEACSNHPPVIQSLVDTCVEAGTPVSFWVVASDPDSNRVTLSGTGGPFVLADNPATFTKMDSIFRVSSLFSWTPDYSSVQKQPYNLYFKAEDNGSPVHLVDIKTMNITVVAPSPKNLIATPIGNSIHLVWNKSVCPKVTGYTIFRKSHFYGYVPNHCETGVPAYTGYVSISQLTSIDDTIFIDDNNGIGLQHGIDYCYMITANFADGAESYPSAEVCTILRKDIPVITNVDVQNTSTDQGKILLAWSKPTEMDTLQTPGPYQYLIYLSSDQSGSNFSLLDSLSDLNDTIYTIRNLNTKDLQYNCRIDFYNDGINNRFYIGSTQVATSVFLQVTPSDNALRLNLNFNVPWTNREYVIFKQNPVSLLFDSLTTTNVPAYVDTNLVNGISYCYKVKTIGHYSASGIIDPILNFSQENCGVPLDNVPPCAPQLSVTANCTEVSNVLSWVFPDDICSHDIEKYYIYYSSSAGGNLQLLDSLFHPEPKNYIHTGMPSIAGCYAVVAIDSVGNRSEKSNIVCVDIDSCSMYSLPNVFTPNNDGSNDYFKAFPFTSVQKIDLQIFDRWGKIVYKTNDPAFQWDGKNQTNHRECSDGVYFYVCDVYEITLNGEHKRTLKGSVEIIR